MSFSQPQVIVLIGPTASGKTELAIEIAEYFKTRIHNIDSRQIYKSMDIGTAKPSKDQQKQIKHFLIDIEEPIKPKRIIFITEPSFLSFCKLDRFCISYLDRFINS